MSELQLALQSDVPSQEVMVPPIALARDTTLGFPAAHAPGAAAGLAHGARILHFAPGRWLLTAQAREREADRIERLRRAGAILIDGRAKWCCIELSGQDARSALSGLLPVEQLLAERGCAAATLLECPGVLASREGGLEFWVGRSWAPWLHATLTSWLSRRAPRCATGA
jgi:sarcosine oxidase gamma subunit